MAECVAGRRARAKRIGHMCGSCRSAFGVAAAALVLLFAVRLGAAQEIATVAEVEGAAEIGRAGAWLAAATGAAIQQGDTLRTGKPGRLVIVFQDDSLVTVGDDSELVIDEQVFEPDTGIARSLMHLLHGGIRALVSEYYERSGNEFRVDTKSAVVGVRGSEFIVVFNPATGATDVVGVGGRAEVHSVRDLVGHAVFITAREATTVMLGQYPTPLRRLSEDSFRHYLQGFKFVGRGKPESLAAVQPLLRGGSVPAPDRLASLPAPPMPVAQAVVSGARSAPGETPHDVFSQQNAAGVAGQPPSVVEATEGFTQGRVGIHF
jgi:hypothetical protein